VKHLTCRLDFYNTDYLDEIAHLPIYTSSGREIIRLTPGKIFPEGCVHESLIDAEKCCHDNYQWDNADNILIAIEVFK
jgi:hypothetical protein